MDLLNFMGEQQIMLMLKLDGLTVKLTYENGELLEALPVAMVTKGRSLPITPEPSAVSLPTSPTKRDWL